jgi:hypothetical protein
MRIQPTNEARPRPKSGPDFTETNVALLPALAALRGAQNGVEAMALLEESIPAHLVLPALAVIAGRSHLYRADVVKTLCQLTGLPALKNYFGRARALALWERFNPIDGTA